MDYNSFTPLSKVTVFNAMIFIKPGSINVYDHPYKTLSKLEKNVQNTSKIPFKPIGEAQISLQVPQNLQMLNNIT
jgi:hypothetical protein